MRIQGNHSSDQLPTLSDLDLQRTLSLDYLFRPVPPIPVPYSDCLTLCDTMPNQSPSVGVERSPPAHNLDNRMIRMAHLKRTLSFDPYNMTTNHSLARLLRLILLFLNDQALNDLWLIQCIFARTVPKYHSPVMIAGVFGSFLVSLQLSGQSIAFTFFAVAFRSVESTYGTGSSTEGASSPSSGQVRSS